MKGIDNMGNIKGGYRHTEKDLKDNFDNIVRKCGHIPLFNEFSDNTKISDITYASRLGLKGKVYDKIVEKYTTKNDYDEYIKRKSEHKTKVGKKTGAMSAWYSDEWMESNFRYVFETCMNKYDIYPSRRYFDKMSITDSRNYRKRYNMSWTKICKRYGYETRQKNIEETICLNMCKEILGCDYEWQKTWDWLIGCGGKHMYCDGYFTDINMVIEFDGAGHRKPTYSEKSYIATKNNDKLKDKLIPEHGINIIRIDSRCSWQDEKWLENYLLQHINISKSS